MWHHMLCLRSCRCKEERVDLGAAVRAKLCCGVFAPVPMGVDTLDGISDVKIVAEDGETRYLVWMVWRSDSLKPVQMSVDAR